jgi:hypothetical protein
VLSFWCSFLITAFLLFIGRFSGWPSADRLGSSVRRHMRLDFFDYRRALVTTLLSLFNRSIALFSHRLLLILLTCFFSKKRCQQSPILFGSYVYHTFCWWCLMFKASYHAFGVGLVDRVNIPCSLGLVPITFA